MPATDEPDVQALKFPLRIADIDWLGHVQQRDVMTIPYRSVIEYSKHLRSGDDVPLIGLRVGSSLDVWFAVGGEARAAARVSSL